VSRPVIEGGAGWSSKGGLGSPAGQGPGGASARTAVGRP
jgi:hypothetical protein